MPNHAATKKAFKTRVKIMDAYIDLMKTKNFDSITVKSIVEKANITRGTFYLYFSDIYEMVTYIEEILLSDMPIPSTEYKSSTLSTISPPTYEKCQENAWEYAWFEYYQRYHKPFNVLLGPHGDASFYGKIKKHLQDCLSIRMQQDQMPNDINRECFMSTLPDLFILLAKEWTSKEHMSSIDINGIAVIISTIRVGSLYRHYLDNTMSLKNSTDEQE